MSYPEPYVHEKHNRMVRERFRRIVHFLVLFANGCVYMERDGNKTIKVKKNGWVIVSDGRSKDAMPISMCSLELINRVKESLSK
jgi:hypothetical protein